MKQELIVDFTFIGMGASNCLILKSLIEHGQLKHKNIAIIESDSKTTNDKTYCFWATPDESIIGELKPLISHQYQAIEINQLPKQNIIKQPYFYIKSIDLYNYAAELILKSQIPIFRNEVKDLKYKDGIASIITSESIIFSHYVFDSRPPSFSDLKKNDLYLNQSFYGLHVKCEKAVFNEETFQMMNFNVDQNEFTQFNYILPFSPYEALIELTRFGTKKIDNAYAKLILTDKILNDFGPFEILDEETGCIPMTTYLTEANEHPTILNTGARANLIKPSTGYGFKNMFEFSKIVTHRLASGDLNNFNQIALPSKNRFKFYDYLLLFILIKWPYLGKSIFSTLFKKQNIKTVFAFLDEKTSLLQEMKIFAKLPFKPFLCAAFIYFWKHIQKRYFYATLLVLVYCLLHFFSASLAKYFGNFAVIIGLLLVGIPHGAVDHLIQNSPIDKAPFIFICKYLAIMFLMFLFWQFLPTFALVLFIAYSAFHFGESEYEEAKVKIMSFQAFVKACLMGMAILLFVILSHAKESLLIVNTITNASITNNSLATNQGILVIMTIISFFYIVLQLTMNKKKSNFGLVIILLLGLFTPLMPAFALYFIGQHSINAWQHLTKGLSVSSATLYKKAMPFTLGALFLFVLIVLNFTRLNNYLEHAESSFFLFLSCISCPHIFMMHGFYKQRIF